MAIKLFSIVSGIAFNIPKALLSSFNAHHKTRLVRMGGSLGKVTDDGVKYFGSRTRLTWEETASQLKALGYEHDNARGWFVKNGVDYMHGKGILSLSAFSWALSNLTQAAQAAATKATKEVKPKATRTAKPKAEKATVSA